MRFTARPFAPLVLVLLLAFGLRAYQIGVSPLRGDEAFAVRYWAVPPSEFLTTLAWVEPHPYGTFFGLWLWKSLVGDSEVAMRLLPALTNMLGAAALYALARRLRLNKGAALAAVLLWVLNPGLIWHSQDVRNYATWSGLSLTAFWLLTRAADKNRPRDWTLYALVELLALYTFFLEAIAVFLQLLYVAWRVRADGARARPVLRQALVTAVIMGLLLIPWMYQAYRLAGSGYGGTATRASLSALAQFAPELLYGMAVREGQFAEAPVVLLAVMLLVGIMLWSRLPRHLFLSAWVIIPCLLLALASTRLDVFRARYILIVLPALLLMLVSVPDALVTRAFGRPLRRALGAAAAVGGLFLAVMTADTLARYYRGELPKSPNWPAITAYVDAAMTDDAQLALESFDRSGASDPAFGYYAVGDYSHRTLALADPALEAQVQAMLAEGPLVYLLTPTGDDAIARAFQSHGVQVLNNPTGGQFVSAYLNIRLRRDEIAHRSPLAGGGGRLAGWRTVGALRPYETATLILYWDAVPEVGWKFFVHVVDPAGEIAAQVDRPVSAAAGRQMAPLSLAGVPPGEYRVRFGLYREGDGERAPLTTPEGDLVGEYAWVGTLTVLP